LNDSFSQQDLLLELAEEFAQRYRRGERPALAEYTAKFPALAAQIRELFPALVVMEEFGSVAGPAIGPFAVPVTDKGPMPEYLGEYRILREVARGGMGIVYEAVQESLGRHVALKVLPGQNLRHGNYLARFHREAKAAAGLHHTNIVPVFGVGEHEGTHYYAMQFIQGQALDSVLQELQRLRDNGRAHKTKPLPPGHKPPVEPPAVARPGPDQTVSGSIIEGLRTGHFQEQSAIAKLPKSSDTSAVAAVARPGASGSGGSNFAAGPSRSELTVQPEQQYFRSVAQVGVQVAEALAYAHHQGVLHRDIKPSNLLLDTQGTVWITDFGLAKAEGSDELTSPGDIVGTLRFMAPERFDGRADARSDVFSLGLTLYEMLTLQPAFAESDRARLIKQLSACAPPRPRQVNPHIPRDLETVVLKASAREPGQRYVSAAALAEDLRRFLTDRPIRARRTAWMEHVRRWCLRNKLITSLGSVVALLLIALSAGVLITNLLRDERDRAVNAENEAQTLLQRALKAEQESKIRGHLLKAGAHRRKGQMGQRFQALAEVKKALALKPSPKLLHDLRNEAIACLALPDVRVVKEWDGYPASSMGISFDGALKRYARLDAKGFVTVRQLADDAELYKLSATAPGDAALRLSADGRFLALWYPQGRLKVWQLAGPEPPVVGEAENTTAMNFSPDSQALVVGQANGSLKLLDLATGRWRKLGKTAPHAYRPVFHPGGKQLAVACWTCTQVFDVDTGQLVAEFPHKREFYPCAAWHPDGAQLAVIGGDFAITLWHVATKEPLVKMTGLVGGGHHCAFTPAGDLLVSTGWDGLLRLWNPLTGKELFHTPLEVFSLRFSSDGHLLACSREGTKLRLLEVVAGQEYRTLPQTPVPGQGANPIHGPALSPDGKLLASGMVDGARLWDLKAGRQLAFLPTQSTHGILFDASGALLIHVRQIGVFRCPVRPDAARAGLVKIGPAQRLALPPSEHYMVSSRDGKVIAMPYGSLVRVLDLRHPDDSPALPAPAKGSLTEFGPIQDARYVAISPDGRYVAAGSHHGPGAKVWDRLTKKLVKDLPIGGTCPVTFSPDGQWLTTAAGGCRLWRVGSWAPGPPVSGWAPAFSRDGKVLALETGFGTVHLVDPETGTEYAQLEDPSHDRGGDKSFTPDGGQLVMVSPDSNTIHVWDLRAVRQQLQELGLDWAPPLPPAPKGTCDASSPLHLEVDMGLLGKPSLFSKEGAKQMIAQYLQEWKEKPNSALTCINLAWTYLMAHESVRDVQAALPLAQKALQLAPENPDCRNTLGLAYYRAGQYARAIETLLPDLQDPANPTLGWDLYFLAMSYHRLGDPTQARLYYHLAVIWGNHQKELPPYHAEELAIIRAEAERVLGLGPNRSANGNN
jgi:serine/threonine protein kinase/WD40 repeat protein